jgi:potassium-dependent mechanosensitive channel
MLKSQKIPNQMLRIAVLHFLGFWVHLGLSLFRISISGFRIYFVGVGENLILAIMRKTPAIASGVTLAVFLFLSAIGGKAAEQKPTEAPKTPAPTTPTATLAPSSPPVIPVEEVAMQATQVGNLIRGFAKNVAASDEIETIRKFLPQISADTALELKSTTDILNEQPSLETLQAQEQIWQHKLSQLTEWLNLLTDRATKLQVALTQLKKLQETWTKTRDSEESAKAPPSIVQQIDTTLASIQAAQQPHQAQRDEILNLQSQIAEQVASCSTALAQIAGLQQVAVGGFFRRGSLPLWNGDLGARVKNLLDRLPDIAALYRGQMLLYVRSPFMPRHVAIFIVLLLVLLAARRQVGQQKATGTRPSYVTTVFDHVFAAALLVTLMVATSPASPVPITLKRLFSIAALVPIIVVTRGVLPSIVIPAVYALAILFAIDTVRQAVAGAPSIGQGILALEAVAGIAVLGWLLVYGARKAARGLLQTNTLRRLATAVVLLDLAIGLVAAAFGYMRLARLAIPGVLAGGALALELYASVQVAIGMVACAFRVWPLRLLHMIEHHRDLLERRVYLFLLWIVAVAWLSRYLDYLGLLNPAWDLITEFVNTRFERGSISTSVGDIAAFFLTVLAAYLLSAFIRFVLQEDVYPRTRIAAGQSYALSSLLNYTVLAVGFVVALAVLGMDLTKITVLAGAFGVGLGFGLQSVVNNFVSGLILLFERPIHVGDMVQVGNLQGRVRRIGIRASVVLTAQGAEIIVPNAQLITEQVTNWTLSDQLRRNDLPVGVNYGAEPKKVIELLEGVARAHPKVLQNPAPRCLFMSYGDSSINFELRAWTEYTDSGQVRSDLTVAIYDAVYAAGMSFPFPQRELRVLGEPQAGAASAAPNVVKKD